MSQYFELEFWKQVEGVDFDCLQLMKKTELYVISELEHAELFRVASLVYDTVPLEASRLEIYEGSLEGRRLTPEHAGFVGMVLPLGQRALPYFSVLLPRM